MPMLLMNLFGPPPDPSEGWWPGDAPLGIFNGGPIINAFILALVLWLAFRFGWVVLNRPRECC